MAEIAFEAVDLTKRINSQTVLDGVTFQAARGRITGFLGPNGAGKSMTMHCLAGLSRPSGGQALVDGRPLDRWPTPGRKVGVVLSTRVAHPGSTALDSLRWVARLQDQPLRRCEEVLETVGLDAVADRRTGTFSLGMRQRLALAVALVGDPESLLLDEPMNGLDHEGLQWLRSLMHDYRDQGRSILLSSHLLRELEDLADDVVVIRDGTVVGGSSMAEFLQNAENGTVQVRSDDLQRLVSVVLKAGGQLRGRPVGQQVAFTGLPAKEISRLAREHGVEIDEISTVRRLEDAYEESSRAAVLQRSERA